MILTVAQFLQEFLQRQAALLDGESVKHGPTIGNMYEGLTRDILDRAIPPAFQVRIVDGFIEGLDGRLSPQIDAMLVAGDVGRKLPHTSHHVWPLADVLATFEVKKTLYAKELADGANKSAAIWDMQLELFRHDALKNRDLGTSERAYARWAGSQPVVDMSGEDSEIYKAITAHQFCPVRVVFGFQGYADEHGLRSAFLNLIEARVGTEFGGGPIGLPDLVVCGQNSLLKMSGHPYVVPRTSEFWDFIGSERERPLRLMIELIWTRLANRFKTILPMDDTLEEERIVPLLSTRFITEAGRRGWYYKATDLSKLRLGDRAPVQHWRPVELTQAEYTLFMIANHEGGMDLASAELAEFARSRGWDLAAVAEGLIAHRLMARTGPRLAMPITDRTGLVITSDGKHWGSSNEELLLLWVAQYRAEERA